jgi:DNA-binding transcriptional LysR family regulator
MTLLTLRQLEIFVQVVRLGSFRRCAEHIGVSQVAISDHIRSLEAGLGRPLFQRHAGGPASLTPEGERAYKRATNILTELNELALDFSNRRNAEKRRYRMGSHPFIMRYLQQSAASFSREHPEVDFSVDLDLSSPELIKRALLNGEIDLGYFFALDDNGGLDSEVMRSEPLAIFISENHPLSKKDVVSVTELVAVPAVQLTTRSMLRGLVDRALERTGLLGGPVVFETDEYGLIVSSLKQNLGFACMFETLAADLAGVGGIKRLRLPEDLPSLQVRRAVRPGGKDDTLLGELILKFSSSLRSGQS